MSDRDFYVAGSVMSSASGVVEQIASAKEMASTKATHNGLDEKFRQPDIEEEQPSENFAHQNITATERAQAMAQTSKYANQGATPCMSKGRRLEVSASDLEVGLIFAKQVLDEGKAKENQMSGNGEGSSKTAENPDVFTTYQKHLGSGGKRLSEIFIKKSTKDESRKAAPVGQKEDWGKWQRMGGDPRMHKAFSLEGAPYPASGSATWVGPGDTDEGKDDDTIKSVSEEPHMFIKMRGQMSPEEVDIALEELQRGKEIKSHVDDARPRRSRSAGQVGAARCG